MLVVYSPDHHYHNPKVEFVDGKFSQPFEHPRRAEIVLEHLRDRVGRIINPKDFGLEPILRVHDAGFVQFLQTFWDEWALERGEQDAFPFTWIGRAMRRDKVPKTIDGKLGYYSFDAGTPITAGTWQAATASVNVTLTAGEFIVKERTAFALCRPPGHHATRDCYGGYCFLNNAAIAAQSFRDAGADRVAVLDVDYHHGNGTQAIFYHRRDVLFVSLHADPHCEYPFFAGYEDERGEGEGEGYNYNYPLLLGTNWQRYQEALDEAIRAICDYSPDVLVVSLGVDTFEKDPICKFRFLGEDFLRLGVAIARVKKPTLFVMEGGYAIDELGLNIINVLLGFQNAC